MIIYNNDLRYGCFRSHVECKNCKKCVLYHVFDWGTEHIGINDTDKIHSFMQDKLNKAEIKYCCRCGEKLFDE